MLAKTMSAREARANFSDLLGSVFYTKEPVIVEKKGKPVAVVISTEDFQRLREQQEQSWAAVAKVQERNKDKEPEEVLSDVTAEVEAVRQKMYEEKGSPERGR